ncbi:MAG TPA: outer membrane protein assembly factor BamE [Acetobacteraceae bacterium]|nr:outer membrane protein assembly factor BamE [Acetobacteraceae bacterium]
MHTIPRFVAIRRRAGVALFGLGLLLGGCSLFEPPVTVRGNRIDADEMKQLVPGTTTQADATSLLGSPTAKGSFDANSWFYISEMTRPVIGGTQKVMQQGVVVLTFNGQGVLEHVDTLNQRDSLPVAIAGRITPSPGTEATFLQQLLGNVGRFNPGLPQAQSPTGGVPAGRY